MLGARQRVYSDTPSSMLHMVLYGTWCQLYGIVRDYRVERRGSKRFGLALPIGILIVILMRQDALVWVGLKAPDTAKRCQSDAGAGVSRPDPMPVTDMITAKTLPIVVYRIHRHGPFGVGYRPGDKAI